MEVQIGEIFLVLGPLMISFSLAVFVGTVIHSCFFRSDKPFSGVTDRFRRAQNRGFQGMSKDREGQWEGPFVFVQMADTQLGMFTNNEGLAQEEHMMKLAVKQLNGMSPKPKFAIVCGDLINAFPRDADILIEKQVRSFKHVFSEIDPSIPLVCVCGNHDVGNKPTTESIQKYKNRFGDDYLVFWAGGVKNIVINSSLYSDSSKCPELLEEHKEWLEQVLAEDDNAKHIIVYSHIPPFIFDAQEPKEYFNFEPAVRAEILGKLKASGVKSWFCGHFHRNAGGFDESLEVVVTSAVGVQLDTLDNELGLPVTVRGIGSDMSGLRLVKVQEEGVVHKWFTFDRMPLKIDPASKTW